MNTLTILNTAHYPQVLNLYLAQEKQFTLITSVLMQKQKGEVFWDGVHQNFFIIHNFGFCQLLESESHVLFDNCLQQFLEEKKFSYEKLRWYAVSYEWINKINLISHGKSVVVERVQLQYGDDKKIISELKSSSEFICVPIDNKNFSHAEAKFNLGLPSRFWSSKEDFFKYSFGVMGLKNLQPISICYACAKYKFKT